METNIQIPLELDVAQANVLYDVIQAAIKASQKLMRSQPYNRDCLRQRIIRLQEIRRQLPEFLQQE